jgi:hypothetical protein
LKLDNNLLNKHINSKSKNEKINLNNQKDSINLFNKPSKNFYLNSYNNNINNKFRANSSIKRENLSSKIKYVIKKPESNNEFFSFNKKNNENQNELEINKDLKKNNNKEYLFEVETNKSTQIINKNLSNNIKNQNDKNNNINNNDNNILKSIHGKINNLNNKPNSTNNYYDSISNLVNNNDKRLIKVQHRKSLLCFSNDQIDKIIIDDASTNLKRICSNDDEFINFFKNATEDILITYCDAIFKLIKDLEGSLSILKKMKNYVNVTSGGSAYSSNNSELERIFVRDAIEVMQCERVSIFIYDSFSDMLILNVGEGLNRNEIKVPKKAGLVGETFTKGILIRVDDCYADERFDRTFDTKSNFRTKNMLCSPIKDQDNNIIGAIQCINHNDGKFTQDDEIIIDLFSTHIGKILRGAKTIDENSFHISKLKSIISIKDSWCSIKNLIEFACDVDKSIMNIFLISNCQLYFHNKNKNNLIKIGKYDMTVKSLNIGIIGYVYASGKYYGTLSSNYCEFYNHIIDIECGTCILTYPIKVDDKVKGVLQFSYNGKLIQKVNKPMENDEVIINYFLKEVEQWFLLNQNVIDEFMEKNV